jgi:ribosome maturation factor RimP
MAYLRSDQPLWAELASIAADEGLELYDAEQFGPSQLRVFVDKKGEHVSSGDCSRMVRRLMIIFQAQGPQFGLTLEPEIEVSSPGVNRQLRLPAQFGASIGARVKIVPVQREGLNMVTGVLRSALEQSVEVEDEATGKLVAFNFADIKRANVEYKFS